MCAKGPEVMDRPHAHALDNPALSEPTCTRSHPLGHRHRPSVARRKGRYPATLGLITATGVGSSLFGEDYALALRICTTLCGLCLALLALVDIPNRLPGRLAGLLLAFTVWSATSVAWGESWHDGVVAAVSLAGMILFALSLAAIRSYRFVEDVLLRTCTILCCLSLVATVLLPSRTIIVSPSSSSPEQIRFTGLFQWNSQLGMVAALLVIFSTFRIKRGVSVLSVSRLLLALATLALSGSVTSYISCAVAILVWFSFRTTLRFFLGLVIGLISIIALNVYGLGIASLLGLFGRTGTLTGRTGIWRGAQEIIAARPWLGYGIGNAPASAIYSDGLAVENTHNGYLQIWIETGFIGLVVIAMAIMLGLYSMIKSNDRESVAICAFMLIANGANSFFLGNGLFSILLFWILLARSRCVAPKWPPKTAHTEEYVVPVSQERGAIK